MDITPNHDTNFLPKIYVMSHTELEVLISSLEKELYHLTKNDPPLPKIELLRMKAFSLNNEIEKKRHWKDVTELDKSR
jgi:hypothetical protein